MTSQSPSAPETSSSAGNDAPAHRTCPLCGSDNAQRPASRWSRGEWIIKECGDCAFPYLENAPVYERLKDEFAWEKTSEKVTADRKAAAPVRTAASRQVKAIKQNVLKREKIRDLVVTALTETKLSGHLVDVGCGTGTPIRKIATELRAAGHEITPIGIEISAELAASAHKKCRKLKGRCLHADALSGFESLPPDSVASIIMSSYLEHEVQPREVLQAALKAMKPGASCIVKVPNFACINRRVVGANWCGFRYPDHVNYFTPATLRRIAEDSGFEIARQNIFDCFPLSDNMYAVLRKPA